MSKLTPSHAPHLTFYIKLCITWPYSQWQHFLVLYSNVPFQHFIYGVYRWFLCPQTIYFYKSMSSLRLHNFKMTHASKWKGTQLFTWCGTLWKHANIFLKSTSCLLVQVVTFLGLEWLNPSSVELHDYNVYDSKDKWVHMWKVVCETCVGE